MGFRRISTLQSMLVIGVILAMLPLLLVVLLAVKTMRDSTALGHTLDAQVFEQTKAVQSVMQKTGDIERKARLYVLLSDPALRQPYERESYEMARSALRQALDELLAMQIDSRIALRAKELAEKEILIYQQIVGGNGQNPALPVDGVFQGFRASSNALSHEFESHVDRQFAQVRLHSASFEAALFNKGALLLTLSLLLIVSMLWMLTKSQRQLRSAVACLVEGQWKQPIEINGPRDMSILGERLEWLRGRLLDLSFSRQLLAENVAREIEQRSQALEQTGRLLTVRAEEEANAACLKLTKSLNQQILPLQALADAMKSYAQIDQLGDAPKQLVAMQAVVDAALFELEPAIEAKSIILKPMIRSLKLEGNPQQLRYIVDILLEWAVQRSPHDGEIRISLRDSDGRMELDIEDEGPFIATDQRKYLFEPLQSADSADGPWLSLAQAKAYVINHRGKIEILDCHQQLGARVRVLIPVNGGV